MRDVPSDPASLLDKALRSAQGSTGLALSACRLSLDMLEQTSDPQAARAALHSLSREFDRRRPLRGAAINAFAVADRALDVSVGNARSALGEYEAQLLDAPRRTSEHIGGSLGGAGRIATLCYSRFVVAAVERLIQDGALNSAVVLETRPGHEGWQTAQVIKDLGADVTLTVDASLSLVLDDVDAVLVGADLIAGDGSVVNRIGTATLAEMAGHRGIPSVVVTGLATCVAAMETAITPRPRADALPNPANVSVRDVTLLNLADDVTQPHLIRHVVCELGVFPMDDYVSRSRETGGAR